MYGKSFVVPAAAALLLAGAATALAGNFTDERDSGNSAHQTELDEQYARSHHTIVPGTLPPRTSTRGSYGYVSPHHSKTKRTPSHGN